METRTFLTNFKRISLLFSIFALKKTKNKKKRKGNKQTNKKATIVSELLLFQFQNSSFSPLCIVQLLYAYLFVGLFLTWLVPVMVILTDGNLRG